MKTKYIAIFLVIVLLIGVAGVSTAKEKRWKHREGIAEYYYPYPAGDNLSSRDPYLSFFLHERGRFHLRDTKTSEILIDCELPKMNGEQEYWSPTVVYDGIIFNRYALNDEGKRIIVHVGFDGVRTDYNYCDGNRLLFWDERPFLVKSNKEESKLVATYLDDCSFKWELEVDPRTKKGEIIYTKKIQDKYLLLGNSNKNGFKQIVDVRSGRVVCDVPGEYGKYLKSSDHYFLFDNAESLKQKMTFIRTSDWKVVREYQIDGKDRREWFKTITRDKLVYFVKVLDYERNKFSNWSKCEIEKFDIEAEESEFFVINMQSFIGDIVSNIELSFKDIFDDLLLVTTSFNTYLFDITRDQIVYDFEDYLGMLNNGRVPSIRDDGEIVYLFGGFLKAFNVNTLKYLWSMKVDDMMSFQEIGDLRYQLTSEIRNGEYYNRIDVYNMKSEMFEPYSYNIPYMYHLSDNCFKYSWPEFFCISRHGILCMPFMPDNKFKLFKPGVDEPYYEIISPFRDNFYITKWEYSDNEDVILIHTKMSIPGDKVIEKFYDYEFNILTGLLTEIEK